MFDVAHIDIRYRTDLMRSCQARNCRFAASTSHTFTRSTSSVSAATSQISARVVSKVQSSRHTLLPSATKAWLWRRARCGPTAWGFPRSPSSPPVHREKPAAVGYGRDVFKTDPARNGGGRTPRFSLQIQSSRNPSVLERHARKSSLCRSIHRAGKNHRDRAAAGQGWNGRARALQRGRQRRTCLQRARRAARRRAAGGGAGESA